MLATQLNILVDEKKIEKNTLLKLTKFAANIVQGQRLIIILGAEPVPWPSLEKIGTPTNANPNAGTKPGGAATTTNVSVPVAPAAPGPAPAGRGAMQAGRGGGTSVRVGRGGAAGGPRGGAGGAGGGAPPGPLYPIEGLSPYQNKWTIKARVVNRSEIKHWSNQRGEGKLFSVTLMDDSGEIRATGFNEAVDNFYDKLQEGKAFYISRARVNIAKKQFSNVNNEYEIMFENHTEIEPCLDEDVPQVKYSFVSIADLAKLEKDAVCDVLAVVKEVHELGSINSKATQKPFSKRDIVLVDTSMQSVRMTLWGKQAEQFKSENNGVFAFKGVKVGDFGGRSLSMFSSSTMSQDPDIPEAHSLRGWYDAEGHNATFNAFSNTGMSNPGTTGAIRRDEIKTIGQEKDENIGTTDKQEYFTTKATINFVKHETFSYPACQTEGCNKKVIEEGNGWRCEKCDLVFPQPLYRYILNLSIMDHTGHIWITAFNDVAEQLLGVPANDLVHLKDEDEGAFAGVFAKAQAKALQFQCTARQDTFNDQPRVRYSARKAIPIDFKTEAKHLITAIEAL